MNDDNLIKELDEILGPDERDNERLVNKILKKIVEDQSKMNQDRDEYIGGILELRKAIEATTIDPKGLAEEIGKCVKSVRVENLKDITIPEQKTEVTVKNLEDIPSYKGDILKVLKILELIARRTSGDKELKVDLDKYMNSNRPLAVRLSDGKAFYEAIFKSISQVGVTEFTTSRYFTNHLDDYTTTSVTYVGLEDKDGIWYMLKIDETGNFPVYTYATVSNNPLLTTYALAWAARTTATYGVFSTAF